MLDLSRQHPKLVTMVVPSPITFEYDATIINILKAGTLGNLLYIEVLSVSFADKIIKSLTENFLAHARAFTWHLCKE